MRLRRLSHRRKETNRSGTLCLVFFCFIVLQNLLHGENNASVECFSVSIRSFEVPTTRTLGRVVGRRTNPYGFDRLSMVMASPLPYYAELAPNNKNNDHSGVDGNIEIIKSSRSIVEKDDDEEEDEEESMGFEENTRGKSLEQRTVERQKQRNEQNSIVHEDAFVSTPWDIFSLGSPIIEDNIEDDIEEDIDDDIDDDIIEEENSDDDIIEEENGEDEEDDEEEERQLSDEQAHALNLIKEGHNVFLTGVAGTGKSLVLKKALQHIKETYEYDEYVAVAPTGSTAVVLEGQTVHSFAGIGIPKIYTDFRKMKSNRKIRSRWQNLKVLLLDEVSMISGEFFDSLSRSVSDIRKDPRPFGGIQLIVCGDFLQLSPIAPRKWEVDQMINGIREKEGLETAKEARNWLFLNRGFCFQSEAWKAASFEMVELKHVFRQNNRDFVNILQNIRLGNVTSDTVRYLRDNCERPLSETDSGIQPTILHSKNVNVAKENLVDLEKLSGETITFEAFDKVEREKGVGKWVEKELSNGSFFKACTADKKLQLKLGAQVMLIKNVGYDSVLTNGSRGTVIGFRKVKKTSDTNLLPGVDKYPVVRFKNGLQQVVTPQKFQSRILGMGTCTRTMIPLKLAWAITTHKAQGMTLDYVIADVGQVFAEAQLYVALSRVSDETGLELRNFSRSRVRANPVALRFHKDPNLQFPFWWDLDGSDPKIMSEKSKSKPTNKQLQDSASSPANQQSHKMDSGTVLEEQILKKKTVVELKQMLRERKLKVSGRKAELIERLMSTV